MFYGWISFTEKGVN